MTLVVTWMDPALAMGAYASKCLAVDPGDAEGVIAAEGRPLIRLGDLHATRPEGRLSGDIPGAHQHVLIVVIILSTIPPVYHI